MIIDRQFIFGLAVGLSVMTLGIFSFTLGQAGLGLVAVGAAVTLVTVFSNRTRVQKISVHQSNLPGAETGYSLNRVGK